MSVPNAELLSLLLNVSLTYVERFFNLYLPRSYACGFAETAAIPMDMPGTFVCLVQTIDATELRIRSI